ncbi:MAG TPA: BON domain-containing protein [Longimicrobiaceae bacterium]|nr:BON domain-containing protein [Longimicrobiaceae bacterium]
MLKRTARAPWRGAGRGRGALLACVLAATAGCGVLGRSRTVRLDPVEVTRIQREVEARLVAEPVIDAAQIRVEVLGGGTVALHGPVNGFGALQCAIANASLVRGVENVVDFMVLRPGPSTVRCLAPRSLSAVPPAPSPSPEA